MRIGDTILVGKGGNLTYSRDNRITHIDAFVINTPTTAVEAPLGEDAVVLLPGGHSGTVERVVVFNVVPESEREPTDTCAAPILPRGKWAVCTGAIEVAEHREPDDQPGPQGSTELSPSVLPVPGDALG